MNASDFIRPSVSRFWNGTPSCSKRSQAATTSGTDTQMWPKPRGSLLPSW